MRIGELLSRIVHLSDQDIEEVLQEQKCTNKRFGDVAIAMGLCRPNDVWRAWSGQLDQQETTVDLDVLGIDAQATTLLPAELAHACLSLPVRICGAHLVVATDPTAGGDGQQAVVAYLKTLALTVKFIPADRLQLLRAIEEYYPTRARVA
jgi:hypothetical protein